mmetsp:Transcript_60758/g.119119  ORF Transcript_60758/g.119119 Transcript_60758/m.119119 type:complete len:400 (-) Transcript_60758:629-1828(-)
MGLYKFEFEFFSVAEGGIPVARSGRGHHPQVVHGPGHAERKSRRHYEEIGGLGHKPLFPCHLDHGLQKIFKIHSSEIQILQHHRIHPPRQGEVAAGVSGVGGGEDGHAGAVAGSAEHRGARARGDDNRLGANLLGDLLGRVGDGVRGGGGSAHALGPALHRSPERAVALHLGNDALLHAHRLFRVLSGCGLGAEHHRVGSVHHRSVHVAHLGAGGCGGLNHRLEHLRGHNHGAAVEVAHVDDPPLRDGQRLANHLHPQVPASDHDTVTHSHDGLEVFGDGGWLLKLRHVFAWVDVSFAALLLVLVGERLHLHHVRRRLHEAEGDPVHVDFFHDELQVLAVLGRQRARLHQSVGEVEPFAGRNHRVVHDLGHHEALPLLAHHHHELPVVQQNAVPHLKRG